MLDGIPVETLAMFGTGDIIIGCDRKTDMRLLIWGRRLCKRIVAEGQSQVARVVIVDVDLDVTDPHRLVRACGVVKGLDWRDEV